MNAVEKTTPNATHPRTFAGFCLASCRSVAAQIARIRHSILREFRPALPAQTHLLQLALNEAEALAWQTDFPYLFFPALAMEKAQAVTTWSARQRSLQPRNGNV